MATTTLARRRGVRAVPTVSPATKGIMAEPSRASTALVDYTRANEFDAAIRSRTAHVGIVGLGYAGLPLAVGFAETGFAVTGIDKNRDRAGAVNQRQSYLPDVSDETLAGL